MLWKTNCRDSVATKENPTLSRGETLDGVGMRIL